MSPLAEKMLRDFYSGQILDAHEKRKAEWPWYGRFQHWLFCSWRCPACIELRKRASSDRGADHG